MIGFAASGGRGVPRPKLEPRAASIPTSRRVSTMSSAIWTRPGSASVDQQHKRTSPHQPTTARPWQFFVLAALGLRHARRPSWPRAGRRRRRHVVPADGRARRSSAWRLRAAPPAGVARRTTGSRCSGQRTRAALERRQAACAPRRSKELEFDRAMGKLSDDDFKEMSDRLRARAARPRCGSSMPAPGIRDAIERDLSKQPGRAGGTRRRPGSRQPRQFCASCNDPERRRRDVLQGCGWAGLQLALTIGKILRGPRVITSCRAGRSIPDAGSASRCPASRGRSTDLPDGNVSQFD